MPEPQTFLFEDEGGFPNSRLPLLYYPQAVPPDPDAIEGVFARNGWSGAWRDGIFDYHHFHSIAHEVLGIARGEVRVCFGGPEGRIVTARAGDVVVIPAGVAHCNKGQSNDLLVIGAYPGGADYDIRRGNPSEREEVVRNIAQVPLPAQDLLAGAAGPLRRLWAGGGANK